MPSYWVDPTGRKKLARIKKAPKEHHIEKLVAMYPKLLGHKRKIVWFWKRPNGPGDLFGFDAIGRSVVVEFKRKIGTMEVEKAKLQLDKAEKTIKNFSESEFEKKIQKHYEWFRKKYLSNQNCESTFEKQFKKVTGHKFNKKTKIPYFYVVASYFTYEGLQSAKKKLKPRKRPPRLVTTQILENKGNISLVATEHLAL